MYFMINIAFANYFYMCLNLTESVPLIRNRTTYDKILPLNLSISNFGKTLLHVSTNLKDFIKGYTKDKVIFDLQERHASAILNTSKNFFSNNHIVDIFMFASSIISLISTTLIIYLLCKYKQIRTLIVSLVLHQVKEVGAISRETNSKCKTLAYVGIILTILSLIIVTFLHYRKSRFCKGHRFSNVVKLWCLFQMCKTMYQLM